MSKVLYIKSNLKPEGQSRTFQISDAFIEEYQKSHPEDEIITLDLYKEEIQFLQLEDLMTIFGPKNEESKNHPTENIHINLRVQINIFLVIQCGI